MWKQRARVQWLAEGDKNTEFFHQKATNRRRKNQIVKLTHDDGTICEELGQLEEMVLAFYENLYVAEGTIGIKEVLSQYL